MLRGDEFTSIPGLWAPAACTGSSILHRNNAAFCLDDTSPTSDDDMQTVYCHGGSADKECFGDLFVYQFRTHGQKPIVEVKCMPAGSDAPCPRTLHAMCVHDNGLERVLLMYGGITNNSVVLWDLVECILETGSWHVLKPLSSTFTPPGMCGHRLVSCGSCVYLIGGIKFEGRAKTKVGASSMYSWSGTTWTVIDTPIEHRFGHCTAVDRNSSTIYIFGGRNCAKEYLNDLWCYETEQGVFQRLSMDKVIAPRAFPSCVIYDGILYIVGGTTGGHGAHPLYAHDILGFHIKHGRWVSSAPFRVGFVKDTQESCWSGPQACVMVGGGGSGVPVVYGLMCPKLDQKTQGHVAFADVPLRMYVSPTPSKNQRQSQRTSTSTTTTTPRTQRLRRMTQLDDTDDTSQGKDDDTATSYSGGRVRGGRKNNNNTFNDDIIENGSVRSAAKRGREQQESQQHVGIVAPYTVEQHPILSNQSMLVSGTEETDDGDLMLSLL